jgi:hypothetical protein
LLSIANEAFIGALINQSIRTRTLTMSKKVPNTKRSPKDGSHSAKGKPAQRLAPTAPQAPTRRADSKQAEVLRLLRRPEGATVAQICEATGWQPHTVRGTFAGTFKKRLGLTIASNKVAGEARVYRVL